MNGQPVPNPAETYESYFVPAMSDPFTCLLLEIAAPLHGERVLDVACGTGSVARQVAPLVGPSGTVVATDINPGMLAVARSLPVPAGASIKWLEGDSIPLDMPDDAFDLVLCQQGLQFFPDRSSAAHGMYRVLAKGGRAVISVWQALRKHPVYRTLFEEAARHLGVPLSALDVSFSLYDPDRLRRLLVDAGFQRVMIEPRSLMVRLPEPARFVYLTIAGAATSVPAVANLDPAARDELVKAIGKRARAAVRRYQDGDMLTFPMSTHIALAHK